MTRPASTHASSRRALALGFAALLGLLVAVTLFGVSRIYVINRSIEAESASQALRQPLLDSVLALDDARREAADRLLDAGTPELREPLYRDYQAQTAALAATVERLRALPSDDVAERRAIANFATAASTAEDVHDRAAALALRGNAAAADALLQRDGLAAQDRFHGALSQVVEAERDSMLATVGSASLALREAELTVAVIGVLMVLLGGAVAVSVIRRIAESQNALHREKELAEITLHSIGDGVITLDAGNRVDYMNPVAERYTGWPLEEARGRPLGEVYRVLDGQTGMPMAYPEGSGAERDSLTSRLVGRGGDTCAIRDSYAPIHSSDGTRVGCVVVFHDVSQIQEMAQQLTWQASHDPLTGLINRREFERRLGELIESAQSGERQHAMMYMDLDNFKTVNDTCGHAAGDELLRQLTTVMLSKMRGSDTLARLGGDEFGTLLETCPLDQAVRIANGLREAVRDFRFIWQDKTFGVGVSIGLVLIDDTSTSVSRMLAIADAICYEAKSKGRDRVQVYRPKDSGGAHDELQMVSQINHAFELGNFQLYRQKIVPVASPLAQTEHYEILVRMVDAAGNLIPPSGFMAAAERYNLLSSIERWVISSLVEYLHQGRESGTMPDNALYAVNLSGASINDNSFGEFLTKLLTRYNLPRDMLCFEVTETTAISNLAKAAQMMNELKVLGCRFALDDFGIGMSSFAYLKYLPVDYIKIDGTFVRDMAGDPMDYAIVESVNRIGHILGLKTVAEYVEDAATLEQLRAMGVDYAQGYFLAEPEALAHPAQVTPAMKAAG